MRLPLILVPLVLALSAAAPLAAAESKPVCEKDVLLYLDISNSMRVPRAGGVSRLRIFTRAIGDLLAGSADFLGDGDRVRLVTFSGTAGESFDEIIEGDALSRLSAELARLRGLPPDPNDPVSNATDLTLVLQDLERQLVAGRRTYVILASDFIHDPRNENEKNEEGRKEEFLQHFTDFHRDVTPELLPETIILDANVVAEEAAAVGREITKTLLAEPLNAERIRVIGESAVAQQLRRKIGQPMLAEVVLRSDGEKVQLTLKITNPNAFPVRLLQTKVGNEGTVVDRVIGCGATEMIEISAPPGSRITAEFDVGEGPAEAPAVRDVLRIEATSARVLVAGPRQGTLLLHVDVRKFLADDAKVTVDVAGVRKTVSIEKGKADEPVTFAISLPANAPQLRAAETVHARFSVENGVVLQNGETSGAPSEEDHAKTEGNAFDYLPAILRFLGIVVATALLSTRKIALLIFGAALDSEILDLLPGPARFFNIAYGASYWLIPTYLLSGDGWISVLNAVPAALLLAICVFYLLRFVSIGVWSRKFEPRGTVLPASTAHQRLRQLSIIIWSCTSITFIAATIAISSLVADTVAVAQ
ncbi:MAG TPA: vWA domain-containing protein [Thermoanaerobaculia bacterium]|jgi:hypothetical protein